jgi:hypothetical protein
MQSNVENKHRVQGANTELENLMKLGRHLQGRAVFEIFASIFRRINFANPSTFQDTDHKKNRFADLR